MLKLSITFVITSMQILLDMTLVECKLSPRVYTTRYGSLIGMMIHRNGLRPVEVFSGLQYASTRQTRLRFIPPSSSLEKWIGNRVFYNTSYRGVCPQAYMSGQGISKRPINYLKHRKNIEKHVVYQAEECLMMNLYIPRKGKIKFLIIDVPFKLI